MKYFKYRLILADVSMICALIIVVLGVVLGQENPVMGIAIVALGFTIALGTRSVYHHVLNTMTAVVIAAAIGEKIDKLDKKIEKLLKQSKGK